jgi:hypothetical protein
MTMTTMTTTFHEPSEHYYSDSGISVRDDNGVNSNHKMRKLQSSSFLLSSKELEGFHTKKDLISTRRRLHHRYLVRR